jgi:hypothetical protein
MRLKRGHRMKGAEIWSSGNSRTTSVLASGETTVWMWLVDRRPGASVEDESAPRSFEGQLERNDFIFFNAGFAFNMTGNLMRTARSAL